jgi:putative tryptophan/tyrosine transport system substrate-binding protein
MRRRDLMRAMAGSALLWPLAAGAQQSGWIRRVGILTGRAADAESLTWVEAFRQRLKELGWTDGRNVSINLVADGDVQQWQANAGKMVASAPDVIIVVGNPGVTALQQETRTIPIVFVLVGDPVGSGFVGSLARPGGNITGFMHFEPAMGAKWLEILKAIAPSMTRALVLHLPEVKANVEFVRSAQDAGPLFKVAVTAAGVHNTDDIERAVTAISGEPGGGLILLPNPITGTHRGRIAELAIRHKMPSIAAFRNVVASGALASYGIDILGIYRRAAEYTDRILRGEKPADLPVQAPTRYELIINLKTARAIGLDVPQLLLSRADEVIE